MNAVDLREWLESRDAILNVYSRRGKFRVKIFSLAVGLCQEDFAESDDLNEAVRLAQFIFDSQRVSEALSR